MSSEERAEVRERFQRWQQMPAEQKQRIRERYQEYQSLPAEQQQRIRKQMQAFQDMPEDQRAQLLQRWQAMSPEERQAVREQMHAEASPPQPPVEKAPAAVNNDTGNEAQAEEGKPLAEPEPATLPEHGGRLRDNRMDHRTIETPVRRPR